MMKINWFKRNGIFFIPISWMGWLILAISLVYAIYRFLDIDRKSHSVSDTLIKFSFHMLLIGAIYSTLAYFTCKKE